MLALFYSSRQDLPNTSRYGTEVELGGQESQRNMGHERLDAGAVEIADDPTGPSRALTLYDVLVGQPAS